MQSNFIDDFNVSNENICNENGNILLSSNDSDPNVLTNKEITSPLKILKYARSAMRKEKKVNPELLENEHKKYKDALDDIKNNKKSPESLEFLYLYAFMQAYELTFNGILFTIENNDEILVIPNLYSEVFASDYLMESFKQDIFTRAVIHFRNKKSSQSISFKELYENYSNSKNPNNYSNFYRQYNSDNFEFYLKYFNIEKKEIKKGYNNKGLSYTTNLIYQGLLFGLIKKSASNPVSAYKKAMNNDLKYLISLQKAVTFTKDVSSYIINDRDKGFSAEEYYMLEYLTNSKLLITLSKYQSSEFSNHVTIDENIFMSIIEGLCNLSNMFSRCEMINDLFTGNSLNDIEKIIGLNKEKCLQQRFIEDINFYTGKISLLFKLTLRIFTTLISERYTYDNSNILEKITNSQMMYSTNAISEFKNDQFFQVFGSEEIAKLNKKYYTLIKTACNNIPHA